MSTLWDEPGPIDVNRPVPLCRLTFDEPANHDPDDDRTATLSAMAKRASVASFMTEPLEYSVLEVVIENTKRLAAKLTCPAAAEMALHLGARASDGNWCLKHQNGDVGYWENAAATKTLNLQSMFLSQSIVEAAQAMVLLSTPSSTLPSLFDHSIAVGQFGQCLYIAAARQGVGVSCVGGFHFQDVASSFDLAQNRHAAYVVVLGHAASMRGKHDRVYRPMHRDVHMTFLAGKGE